MTLPIAFLRECLSYDPGTGVLMRLERPLAHFPDERAQRNWNTRWAGKPVKYTDQQGYLRVNLTFGALWHSIPAHRIVFALVHDRWPSGQIDHKNGIRSDNRLVNLREASNAENQQNRKFNRDNSSGFRGVGWAARQRKWRAAISVGGRTLLLGYFATPERAYAAYLAAKAEHHKFQPVPRGEP
jgi:hypothetical protein